MMKNKPFKGVKRVFYKGRMQTFKGILALMIIGGLVLSMMYFCRFAYMEYAVSDAHVVVNYPEIAESGYPDGSRFVFWREGHETVGTFIYGSPGDAGTLN